MSIDIKKLQIGDLVRFHKTSPGPVRWHKVLAIMNDGSVELDNEIGHYANPAALAEIRR